MPRLIFKCPYIRGGSKKVAAHLNNYVRYMATREGAQRIAADKAQLPATKKQQQMVEQLLRDFPLSRGTFEYQNRKEQTAPSRGQSPFGMNVLMTAENRTTHGSRYTGVRGPSSKTRKHRRNRRPRRWSC